MTQLGSGDPGRSLEGEPSFFFGSSKFFNPSLTCFEALLLEEELEEEGLTGAVAEEVEEDGMVVESGESMVSVVISRRHEVRIKSASEDDTCFQVDMVDHEISIYGSSSFCISQSQDAQFRH